MAHVGGGSGTLAATSCYAIDILVVVIRIAYEARVYSALPDAPGIVVIRATCISCSRPGSGSATSDCIA